jgi:hypothetical protein
MPSSVSSAWRSTMPSTACVTWSGARSWLGSVSRRSQIRSGRLPVVPRSMQPCLTMRSVWCGEPAPTSDLLHPEQGRRPVQRARPWTSSRRTSGRPTEAVTVLHRCLRNARTSWRRDHRWADHRGRPRTGRRRRRTRQTSARRARPVEPSRYCRTSYRRRTSTSPNPKARASSRFGNSASGWRLRCGSRRNASRCEAPAIASEHESVRALWPGGHAPPH